MNVQNKTILVTGAGNGMGREITLLLLSKGARVAALDYRSESLNETSELAGIGANRLSLHEVDITDRNSLFKLPEEIIEIHGKIDGIINNAGIIQPFVKVNELSFEAAEKVMNVNFYGMLNITKIFLPHLLQRAEAHIVNISSMGGYLPVPGQSVYGASKAAVKLFTEGLRSELLDTTVRVTVVFPGAIGTQIAANSGVQIQSSNTTQTKVKTLHPARAAEIIIQGMEKNKYRVFVGSDARMTDLFYRISPKTAAEFIFNRMKNLLQ